MTGIKNIIFDLGGVIINLDYYKTRTAFEKAGVVDFDTYYNQAKQEDLFDAYETGRISNEEFLNRLKSLMKISLDNDSIIQCWNAMLMDIPLNRLNLLEQLNSQYRIFLLSNTNAIHIDAFSKYIESFYGYDKFTNLFEKVYYSNVAGLRKPNKEIFELVLSENNLAKNETLFIDDSLQHIEGAKTLRIKTIHHTTNHEIADTLKANGLI